MHRHRLLIAALLLTSSAGLAPTALAAPCFLQPPAPAPAQAPAQLLGLYKSAPGPWTFTTTDADWRDAARNRTLPVRIYTPQPTAATIAPASGFPVIIFSHGLGASRTSYAYFASHLASHGYLVIAPTHPGSDTAALVEWLATHRDAPDKDANNADAKTPANGPARGWLISSINDPANLKNRPQDISFIIDALSKDEALKGRVDLTKIAVAGHSFGAYTAMAIGGMVVDLPASPNNPVSFRDPRVKAILAMSPEGPGTMGITPDAWNAFAAPAMFLTGTRDYGASGQSAAWRRSAFDHITTADAYLITLEGAGHMTFGGRAGGAGDAGEEMQNADLPAKDGEKNPAPESSPPSDKPEPAKTTEPTDRIKDRIRERIEERLREKRAGAQDADQAHHTQMIESLSTAFFDANLQSDAAARTWLGAYTLAKHADCVAEFKPAAAAPKQAISAPKFPITITLNVGEAEDLKPWGEEAKAICEKWYPLINEMLPSDGFKPREQVTILFKGEMKPPAATGGGTINVNAPYVRQHKDDLGMMVHELAHVVQAYPNHPKRAPGWLVEGIADYIRWFKYEPGMDKSRIDPARSSYKDGYRTTAKFLNYLVENRDKDTVKKLNAALRAGDCDEAKVSEILGKDTDELWKEFVATLGKK